MSLTIIRKSDIGENLIIMLTKASIRDPEGNDWRDIEIPFGKGFNKLNGCLNDFEEISMMYISTYKGKIYVTVFAKDKLPPYTEFMP